MVALWRPRTQVNQLAIQRFQYEPLEGQHVTDCHLLWRGGIWFGAGILSGLLGIGSGAAKVLAMDQAMRMQFKMSITASNFMIGSPPPPALGST